MSYKHTQWSPLCLLLYALATVFFAIGWALRITEPFGWLFRLVGVSMVVLALSFHHLSVEDEGDQLSIAFGPLPLFRKSIRYQHIVGVDRGRTSILDGWGIHLSWQGGWVWNIWGRDCVVLMLQNNRQFRVGTDDVESLIAFLQARIRQPGKE